MILRGLSTYLWVFPAQSLPPGYLIVIDSMGKKLRKNDYCDFAEKTVKVFRSLVKDWKWSKLLSLLVGSNRLMCRKDPKPSGHWIQLFPYSRLSKNCLYFEDKLP